jgi:ubiquinone/menaquinone biosynthesis C-methylase UbiE
MGDSKALSKARFRAFAEDYVTSKVHARGEELDRLIKIARPQPEWVVLDVATGGGHTALKFAPRVSQVIATDITPEMLRAAEAHIRSKGMENVSLEPADAENLPFETGSFDLVTCRIAPHHFPNCHRFVCEAARVLKLRGLLLVQDISLPEEIEAAQYVDAFERLRDPSHHRGYSEAEWVALFEAEGLTVNHTEQIVKHHQFLPWAERQGCTPAVVERLVELVDQAPQSVIDWMHPVDFGTPEARFVNHHIIIAGRKG